MNDSLQEIHRALGCGIDQNYFQECFNKLNQNDSDRLLRVSKRYWFTTKLKYEVSFWTNPYVPRQKETSIVFFEIPSLEIYLLCTCLDTLSGKSVYKEFDIWLNERNIQKKDLISIDEVSRLYREYKEQYGINKNLKRLFTELSPDVKLWLAENVVIQPENAVGISYAISPDQLAIKLYKFYFDVWRNKYTHSSVTGSVGGVIELVEELGHGPEWVLGQPSPFVFLTKEKKKWNIYHKSNIDLSLVLSIVVYAASLQFLRIEPSRQIVDNYLLNLHRTRLLHWTIYEFRDNQNLLNFWFKIRFIRDTLEVSPIMEYLDRFIDTKFPTLASTSLKKLLELLDQKDDFEKQLIYPLQEYLQIIQEFNSLIVSFNNHNPPTISLESKARIQRRSLLYSFFEKTASLQIFLRAMNYQLPIPVMALLLSNPCSKVVHP